MKKVSWFFMAFLGVLGVGLPGLAAAGVDVWPERNTETGDFKDPAFRIRSFMADGLTQKAEIDGTSKTIKLRFASDVDLTQVRPYFYYDLDKDIKPDIKPYDIMDLSSPVKINGWIITATQNDVMRDIFVDPENGSDRNDGLSLSSAFRTIEKAKETVRSISDWSGDVIVHLAAGNYNLNQTLEFNGRDSSEKGYSVIYKGDDKNKTIIYSGVHLAGWTKSTEIHSIVNLYEIDVPAFPDGVDYIRDMYVDGISARLTRMDVNHGNISDVQKDGIYPDGKYIVSGNLDNMKNWRNPKDIEFVYEIGWTYSILPVDHIDSTGVYMKQPPFHNSQIKLNNNPNKPTYIQNAFELLKNDNEWYFDRGRRKIYYVSPGDRNPDTMNIILPTLDQLVKVRGTGSDKVYGLSFSNIVFKYTSFMKPHTEGHIDCQANFVYDQSMVQKNDHDSFLKTSGGFTVSYAEGIRINNCLFTAMAAGGVDYEEGVIQSTVSGSTFTHLGAGAIQVGGVKVRDAQPFSNVTYEQGVLKTDAGPDPDRVTEDVFIFNNLIDNIGLNFKGAIGVFAGYVRDFTLAHNVIKNVPYTAVSAGWGWGFWDQGSRPDAPDSYYKFDTPSVQERYVFENNDISNAMLRLNDGGAIYTLSNMPGSVISGNYIHNIPNPYGAIYLDEASGGFVDIGNNVVHHVYQPYFYHLVSHYENRQTECNIAQHDNFFSVEEPTDPEDPGFIDIINNAGLLGEGPSATLTIQKEGS